MEKLLTTELQKVIFFYFIFKKIDLSCRGKWKTEEDIQIIRFVVEEGTKWSKLAKMLVNRTEHNTKNRFFSILSRFISVPIRKLKKTKNYWNKEVLKNIIQKLLTAEEKEEAI